MRRRSRIYSLLSLLVAAVVIYSHSSGISTSIVTPHVTVSGSVQVVTKPLDGTKTLDSLILNASSSINIVMYQFEDPHVENELAQAEARGVAVKVIMNGGYWGKKENTDNDDAYLFFTEHGIAVHWSPATFALTHEKSMVVDDKLLYIMTGNLTPQYYATSRDFGILTTDTNDVSDAAKTFDADWNAEPATHTESNLVWSPGSQQRSLDLINSAAHTIDIYNEEMASRPIVQALSKAAGRGVTVRILMTDSSQWHTNWKTLASAGVQIHYFKKNDPLYIHAKMIMVDGNTTFLGSENFSQGSFEQNRELGIIFDDQQLSTSLKATFDTDWSQAYAWTSQ